MPVVAAAVLVGCGSGEREPVALGSDGRTPGLGAASIPGGVAGPAARAEVPPLPMSLPPVVSPSDDVVPAAFPLDPEPEPELVDPASEMVEAPEPQEQRDREMVRLEALIGEFIVGMRLDEAKQERFRTVRARFHRDMYDAWVDSRQGDSRPGRDDWPLARQRIWAEHRRDMKAFLSDEEFDGYMATWQRIRHRWRWQE